MKLAPSGSPMILVFWRKISSPNFKGFPRTGASKMGRSEKFSDFLALGVNISNKKAVLPQGNRAMPQVFFSVEVRQQHSCLLYTSDAADE